ncbi:type IV toxin-antitoxin system AbiEi family antitoxin domain-containing protein [Parenemella sanctibonifatiensis]|uniref:type IV toxin-antitoxin system AbiEi family antitoxin domain-containing protein n=1 Tax=Parenemella sanctibonifatiensis TaxID=2016505 RepID=UPI0015C58856|nr:type IV toxin-antitoxin system AbiEi family antitoxin domain-containing protein [Parenemella sanctibonifatiensis]
MSLKVIRTAELRRDGWSDWKIRKAAARGDLVRLRRGWYADGSSSDPDLINAVRQGGAISCITALERLGVFVPSHSTPHVRRTERSYRRRGGCRAHGCHEPVLGGVDDIHTALRCAIRCMTPEWILVIVESIHVQELMTMSHILDAVAGAPRWVLQLLERLDQAESGTETLVRLWLRRLGIKMTCQVTIVGVGRVDLLIGQRLVIEVDGFEYHSSPEQFEKDRQRDRRLVALGYLVVRLSYRQVMENWDEVLPDILRIIRTRAHRRPPKGGGGLTPRPVSSRSSGLAAAAITHGHGHSDASVAVTGGR